MQIALELIGALIVIGLIALGVEKYIEFLKSRSAAPKSPTDTSNGDQSA